MTKQSMAQYVYEKLKAGILSQKLNPGQKLIENDISDTLGVSRTPIRNAFSKLQEEGIVTILPNKGAHVINPAIEEIIEAFTFRKHLELIATEHIMERIEEKDIEKLKELIHEEIETYDQKDLAGYIDINTQFHKILVNISDNRFLKEQAKKMIHQTHIYLILYDQFYVVNKKDSRGPKEHQEIVNLIESRDADAFKLLLDKHISSTIEEYRTRVNTYQQASDLF
ncbi:DNA-binding transcriptional regulator, GntR family [Virgibacillus subterraneus]|uniref:DNA-binding transcriptional regulator, GntR family n=1 Tax=Virgibacillus subterraneus TaxID=621109 RepID=A0A1H9APV8_9BACI|nr:GntR family transcriptional regulator [Virgibacillus subterraneus]SEP78740.1 DNA-binding transcriptional regulator, GntR family [Virgibacillus subterraneus]